MERGWIRRCLEVSDPVWGCLLSTDGLNGQFNDINGIWCEGLLCCGNVVAQHPVFWPTLCERKLGLSRVN